MAYSGTTAGSSVANPPFLISQGIASTGIGSTAPSTGTRGPTPSQWMYKSTHTQAESAAAGFFTDARILGMKLGDMVMVIGSTTMVLSNHTVQALSSTGASLSAGLLVSSAS